MAWLFNSFWIVILFLSVCEMSWARSYRDFPQVSGKIGSHKISKLYLAATDKDRRLGLMNVSKIDGDTGVLFVFEKSEPLSFWMKNTFVPLSIGFFDTRGCLIEVQDMEPVTSVLQTQIPQYQSSKPAQFALEVQKGWFKSKKVRIGAEGLTLTDLPRGSKAATKTLTEPPECTPREEFKGN